jgi:hypothetical protein
MGIKQLFTIIKENAPAAIKTGEIKNHFGRKVAIVSTSVPSPPCQNAIALHLLTNAPFDQDAYGPSLFPPFPRYLQVRAFKLTEHAP